MSRQNTTPFIPAWIIQGFSELAVVIGLTMFLPIVIHMIPSWDDSPVGGKLLPIFYAPLVAALTRKMHVSLIACIVSPWLNHLLTGNPTIAVASMLCIQLIPFAYLVYVMGNRFSSKFWIGPAAYLISKPSILLLFYLIPQSMPRVDPLVHFWSTTLNAIPGVIILALISHFCTRIFPPNAHA